MNQGEKIICVRTVGGEVGPAAVLAPKVGPLGLPPKKVGEDIRDATLEWKGLKVTCRLTIVNRQYTIDVLPSASSLLIRELNEPPRKRKIPGGIKHHGNISLDQIFNVSRIMREKSSARCFIGTVKEILGTANSLGCTVENDSPKNILSRINSGEINIPLQ